MGPSIPISLIHPWKSNPNVYNCKFYNVENEFNVTDVGSYNFFKIFSNLLILAAFHRLLIIFTDEILCLYCTSSYALDRCLPHTADPYLYQRSMCLICTTHPCLYWGGGGDYSIPEPHLIREMTCGQCCLCLQHKTFVRGQYFFH